MLKLIIGARDVTKCHRLVKSRLEPFISIRRFVSVGFRGDNVEARVNYSRELDIWWFFYDNGNSFWNPFGIGEPSPKHGNSITCEINYVKSGRPTSLSGAFAKDEFGGTVLLHTGRIGGGRKGIGRSLFLDNYVGKILDVQLQGATKAYAPVGALESDRFPFQVALFVKEISRIKQSAKTAATSPPSSIRQQFRQEFAGKKTYQYTKAIAAQCDHGLLVRALEQILKRRGLHTANDTNRDLYTLTTRGAIQTVFEFKTDTTAQSLYTAVGQLLLNNLNLPHEPRLVLVIPSGLSLSTESVLKRLGIRSLVYSWHENKPVFRGEIV